MANTAQDLDLGRYQLGWSDEEDFYVFKPKKGLNEDIVREMSWMKGEPEWMTQRRLKALRYFERRPMPTWGGDMSRIDFNDIFYYIKPIEKQVSAWDELPQSVKATYDKLGIPEAERKYLAGVTAQYECLRGSTPVWTDRGARPIKELVPGDVVFSLDPVTRELVGALVAGVACSGEKQVFEVKVGLSLIGASSNHPFLALRDARPPGRQRARYREEWVAVEDLKPGDYVAVATDLPDYGTPAALLVPEAGASRLPTVTDDDVCWWAGAYLGDGYLRRRGAHLSLEIAVDRTDEALVQELCRVGESTFGVTFGVAGDGLRLTGRKNAALAAWVELNGLGGSAHTKRIPDWVFGLPRSQRLAFLAGYVDTDGNVRSHKTNNDVVITSANSDLLEDARQLAMSCGISSGSVVRVTNAHPFDQDRKLTSYQLRLSGNFGQLPCRSPRRLEKLGQTSYYHPSRTAEGTDFRAHSGEMLGWRRVESITPAGVELTYDIEVEGHHNFVADGVIVHNSEVVYHRNRDELARQGVLFSDMDTALREYPEIVKAHFGKVIPANDNKFAALNSAVWSGGSFIYVPPGVKVEMPLQAYFRINTENMGQFERTLIIADEGAQVHYIEGCSAPVYTTDSLHSAVVEIVCKRGSRVTYTTIQNWSHNVYNLVTKRAFAESEAHMEWIDGNIGCLAEGSRVTTPSGLKPIELVMPGDQVLSYDEPSGQLCFRTVTAKRFSGYQQVREVRSGARHLRVTDNHPFFSYNYDPGRAKKLGRYRLGYVRADQLTHAIMPAVSLDYGEPHKLERGELVTEFTEFSEFTEFTGANQYSNAFGSARSRKVRLAAPETTTDDLMWLFGLFMGDGSIERAPARYGGSPWARVTFSVPSADRARPRLVEVMSRLFPGGAGEERTDGVTLGWSSTELADLFELNGFVTGAIAKTVPDWVLGLPESQRLSLVAGYLDSDGSGNGGWFSIKSVNKALLEAMADVLTSLGIASRFHREEGSEGPVEILGNQTVCHGSRTLVFRADPRLLALVSGPLADAARSGGARKVPSLRRVGRSQIVLPDPVEVRKVVVSEPGPAVPTWDIEVEGTGNFVSEGFIVHNSQLTMKYPSVYLMGPKASGEVLSVAYAGAGQHQDAGAKMVHAAPETTSTIISKSISKDAGRTSYRGLVRFEEGAKRSKSFVRCDALLLDEKSRSDTYPYIEFGEHDAQVGHEATISKVGDDQLFYLMSRGLSEQQAMSMIVNGFIEPVTRTLPMEYAVEWSRLIELQMEGSVG
ncbi:MAG TPA: SufD family Fe-S cluster assembly protein [Acidimicrobiales bacterium]|nr:SufD family Fe-S cluster assembly protein [Acidimicrobiales bacterium]